MKAFEAKLKADALVNSKEWFGKNITSPDVIDALYTPMLRYPKKKDAHGEPTGELDFERPPTLKIKIPYWEGNLDSRFSMIRKSVFTHLLMKRVVN